MFELLAQVQDQGWLRESIEKLARTPISTVLYFTLACTIGRVGIHYWLRNMPAATRKSGGARIAQFVHDLCDALVYAGILVFLLIRPFAVQTFVIPSESMVPTLRISDLVIVNKAVYRYSEPKAGDVVVFKPPTMALRPGDDPNTDFVKRLVGVPGDTVEVRANQMYRNGIAIDERYLNEGDIGEFKLIEYPPGSGELVPIYRDSFGHVPGGSLYMTKVQPGDIETVWAYEAQQVPEGKLLMMGDNRNASSDGRIWGLIDRNQVVGKAWAVFWPFSRMSRVE